MCWQKRKSRQYPDEGTHTHTYIYIYIYIYMKLFREEKTQGLQKMILFVEKFANVSFPFLNVHHQFI